MSSRGSRGHSSRGSVRNTRRRKNVLDVDLNAPPHENQEHEGSSAHSNSQDVQGGEQGGSMLPTPIDVEAFDDDVFISSPRAFAEAKNNSRRNRGFAVVVDVDSEERSTRDAVVSCRNKRRRVVSSQTNINDDELFIYLDGSSNSVNVEPPPPPPPPPRETTFKCPVCLGQLIDATSTKCGHIFCKDCLKAALAAQPKCPSCRKRAIMKDSIRVYLPATN